MEVNIAGKVKFKHHYLLLSCEMRWVL